MGINCLFNFKTYCLCIFFVCLGSFLFGQNNVQFEGMVVDSLNNPLSGANVLSKQIADKEKVQFTTTDSNGFFTLNFTLNQSYEIQISYLGYAKLNKEIKIDTNSLRQTFILKEQLNELEEVIIKNKQDIIRKKDTLLFNAKAFIKGTERNLEDLLKQLPGISIDSEGRIKVNGQEIETILIENDDFLGKRYQLISKNLKPNVLDTIEVISKFQKNKLLKGIVESNKKVINLKLKPEFKQVWFGNLDLGHDIAGEKFFEVNPNLIKLGGKAKHYFIGNFNNKGESGGNNEMIIDFSSFNDIEAIAENQQLNKFVSKTGFNLLIDSKRYNDNFEKLGNYNSIINLSEKVKLTSNFIGQWNKRHFLNHSFTEYLNGLDISNRQSEDLLSKQFSGNLTTSLEADLSKNENLNFYINLSNSKERSNQIDILDTLEVNEALNNHTSRGDFKGVYVNRISSKSVLGISSRAIFEEQPESYQLNRFLYDDLFYGNLTADSVAQRTRNRMNVYAWNTKFITKLNESSSFELKLGQIHRNDQLRNHFKVYNQSQEFFPDLIQTDQIAYSNKFYFDGLYKQNFGDFRLRVNLTANYLRTQLKIKEHDDKKRTFKMLQPTVNLAYRIDNKQSVSLSYNKRWMPSPVFMVGYNPVLMSLRSFGQGLENFEIVGGDNWSWSYNYGNWTDEFNTSLRFDLGFDDKYFTHQLLVNPNYIMSRHLVGKNQKRFMGSFETNWFIKNITSNLAFNLDYLFQEYEMAVNSESSMKVTNQNWFFKSQLTSGFSGFYNYNLFAELYFSRFKTVSNNSSVQSKVTFINHFYLSDKLSFSTDLSHYQFSNFRDSGDFFLDLTANYKTSFRKKEMNFYFQAKNLFNNKEFSQTSISDLAYTEQNFKLLPRMIFLGISFSF